MLIENFEKGHAGALNEVPGRDISGFKDHIRVRRILFNSFSLTHEAIEAPISSVCIERCIYRDRLRLNVRSVS